MECKIDLAALMREEGLPLYVYADGTVTHKMVPGKIKIGKIWGCLDGVEPKEMLPCKEQFFSKPFTEEDACKQEEEERHQVAEEVKEARRDEIMELQQEISYDKGTDRIGQELLVMIEGKVADESAYIGRTYGDAPKVDGYIFVQTGELLMTGDFAKVRVTGALEYDLIGELADEYTE